MENRILESFLRRQRKDGMALAQQSDIVDIEPVDLQHYVVHLHCKGLVRSGTGEIVEASESEFGIWFPEHYLRQESPFILSWRSPEEAFHPNILPPLFCIGPIKAGARLVDLLYRAYEVVSFQNVTVREDNAFNADACVWARRNQHRFPLESRPLKRRCLDLPVEPVG